MSQHSSSSDPSTDGPDQIGQYEVTGRIGRGSFGVVYKGRDPYLKRDVAIKVCTVDDEKLRRRFYREAEIAGKLEHDHVVAVHAFGFEDEKPYLVQEFLEGQDLSHLIRQRVAWTGIRKLDILEQIAEALAYAHGQGVIHRDVKPANVRVLAVDPEVKVKLMDFGIAKLAHDESQLTQKGVTMGTASYLPPEQVKGGDVDHRGDIFAFGVLAYELFTMERPFRGQTLSALVYQILYKAPKKLDEVWPGCPPELSQWVHKCLQKDPDARFGDFEQVLDELAPLREGAAVGQWPALAEVWLPEDDASESKASADAPDPAASETTSPTPPPLPRRAEPQQGEPQPGEPKPADAARDTVLDDDSLGSQTRVITPDPGAARVDFDATQPVSRAEVSSASAPADASGEREAVDAAATRRVPMPAIPGAGEGTDVPEELRTSAHEIGQLVEKGDLEAAMAQLEETIHRHRGMSSSDGVTGVLPKTKGDGPEEIDAERPTVEIPRATTEAARAKAPPPLPTQSSATQSAATQSSATQSSATQSAATQSSATQSSETQSSATQSPSTQSPSTQSPPTQSPAADPELSRSPAPPPLPGAAPSADDGTSGPSSTATAPSTAGSSGLPRRSAAGSLSKLPVPRGKALLIGAFAVAAILAVVVGWWLGRGRSEQAPPVVEVPPAPQAPETTPQTGLVVQSTPWAEVTEISNADGYVVDLPADASTPLYLPLEPGQYTVIVRYPEGNEEQRCEVQVTAEQSATCVTPFTQPTASDYFKDAGWWR